MKWAAAGVLLMLLGMLVSPAMADSGDRYSYVTVESITVELEGPDAVVTVNYSIDSSVQLLVLLVGKSDLQKKVLQIANFEDATVEEISTEQAVIKVKDAAYDYGDGIYWFPGHDFNVVVPSLTVKAGQSNQSLSKTRTFPNGIGYFDGAE
ncbi:MAG: hypothetical protein PHV57_01205 [Methanomicrobiaceae archaeon]|nr:hypothetical protein [Methanomicrobiaceae archaeon]